MRRLALIAAREFHVYTATWSFWLALVAGPLLMALAALTVAATERAPDLRSEVREVEIIAEDMPLATAAAQALEGASLSGRTTLIIEEAGGQVHVRARGAALPPDAMARVQQSLAAARREAVLRASGAPEAAIAAAQAVRVDFARPPAKPKPPIDPAAPGRFALMTLLWMNLTGALGMLLQAIVRERSNRALETLLSAARPHEIILGKLAGVLGVSLLAVAAWVGAGAGLAALWRAELATGASGQIAAMALSAFKNPAALAEAAVVYLLAYGLYGSALLGLGATAKDLPSAQNLMRPVFGLLLIVFFMGMARVGGTTAFDSLVLAPPIAPFLLLTAPPEAWTPAVRAGSLALLGLAAVGAAWAASRSLVPRGAAFVGTAALRRT